MIILVLLVIVIVGIIPLLFIDTPISKKKKLKEGYKLAEKEVERIKNKPREYTSRSKEVAYSKIYLKNGDIINTEMSEIFDDYYRDYLYQPSIKNGVIEVSDTLIINLDEVSRVEHVRETITVKGYIVHSARLQQCFSKCYLETGNVFYLYSDTSYFVEDDNESSN